MLSNAIFKVSIDSKRWAKAAFVRSLRAMSQTLITVIGSSAMVDEVNWKMVFSSTVIAGIITLLSSFAGLPEVAPKVSNEEEK